MLRAALHRTLPRRRAPRDGSAGGDCVPSCRVSAPGQPPGIQPRYERGKNFFFKGGNLQFRL